LPTYDILMSTGILSRILSSAWSGIKVIIWWSPFARTWYHLNTISPAMAKTGCIRYVRWRSAPCPDLSLTLQHQCSPIARED
jgi:hypothetical protein